jgi:hypothetical protein
MTKTLGAPPSMETVTISKVNIEFIYQAREESDGISPATDERATPTGIKCATIDDARWLLNGIDDEELARQVLAQFHTAKLSASESRMDDGRGEG